MAAHSIRQATKAFIFWLGLGLMMHAFLKQVSRELIKFR
jgi:hypothetical protein